MNGTAARALQNAMVSLLLACGSPNRAHMDAARNEICGAPAPAGRWMHLDLDDSPCIDCATPRYAVVAAAGSLEHVAERAKRAPASAPGFPMLMLPGELGLPGKRILLVDSLFANRSDADCRHRQLGPAATLHEIDWEHARQSPFVIRTMRAASGYDATQIRQRNGSQAGLTPNCALPQGEAQIVDSNAIYRPADGAPWVLLHCATGTALFPARETDYGLVIAPDGAVEWQDAGGVCGVRRYERRDRSGAVVELSTARCFGEPEGDRWSVCPGRAVGKCAERAFRLFAEGEDPPRAARLAAYACEWGPPSACALRARIDLARGVPPAEVLFDAIARCDADARQAETCMAAEKLLRTVAPAKLADAKEAERGFIGWFGCRRRIPGYCQLLKTSKTCDIDGCG